MEESIILQLNKFQHNWPTWSEVKTWVSDREKRNIRYGTEREKETILDSSLSSSNADNELTWTVDRRFYAVQNDELRDRYYREFVDNMVFRH